MRVGPADSHSCFQADASHASVDRSSGVDLSSSCTALLYGWRDLSLSRGNTVVVVLCRICQSFLWAFLARARVAASRRRPAGAIPASTGRWNTGVGFRQPVMVRSAMFMATSTFLECGLLHQAGAQYSAAEKTRACVEIRSTLADAPQLVPARRRISETLDDTLAVTSSRCCLKESVLSRRTPSSMLDPGGPDLERTGCRRGQSGTILRHIGTPNGTAEWMDPQQSINTLAQMLAEVAAMSRDQAVLSRQQLAALQGQAERQTQLMEAMVSRAGAASPAPSFTGLTLHKMSVHDDPQTFLEMFEATVAACGWPGAEWAVRLLPLLSGDVQTAALGLPAPSRGQYGEIKQAVLDRLGLSAEDHRRRFRGNKLGPADQPFVTRWLQPGSSTGDVLDKIVLEQFVEGLPAATSDSVLCHRPADLAGAITLAEDHLGPAATGAAFDPQRAPQAAGQECWRCGQLGHFRGECPLMEVGQVIRVVGPPAPSPGPGGTYSVPVSGTVCGGAFTADRDRGYVRCAQRLREVVRHCRRGGGASRAFTGGSAGSRVRLHGGFST
ncbi:hypothetical protein N1851_017284 [Merluccius polli]|uniref:CCHC-type domain-containing protein n=1 Tax=Merluccius polli TaxID=89951 RepID=A0AA47MPU4_MERPO|nr:hypothetical protein N1851_017284 [Merluccius polli]